MPGHRQSHAPLIRTRPLSITCGGCYSRRSIASRDAVLQLRGRFTTIHRRAPAAPPQPSPARHRTAAPTGSSASRIASAAGSQRRGLCAQLVRRNGAPDAPDCHAGLADPGRQTLVRAIRARPLAAIRSGASATLKAPTAHSASASRSRLCNRVHSESLRVHPANDARHPAVSRMIPSENGHDSATHRR
jgi:hypothetical protein